MLGVSSNKVHPYAIKVMKEINIDISNHTSKSIDCYADIIVDIAITVCEHAKLNCPVFPKTKNQLHWDIKDPFDRWKKNNKQLKNFREAQDTINNRILNFIGSLEE